MEPRDERRASRTAITLAVLVVAGAAAALLAILDVAPFGGDADEEELTREAFIAEGDGICQRARDRFLELQRDPPRSAAEAAELTAELIEISRGELEDIRSLNPPADIEDDLDRYLAAREQGIEAIEEGLAAAEEGDARAYAQAQSEVAEGQVRRARLARAVGFTACSRPLFVDAA